MQLFNLEDETMMRGNAIGGCLLTLGILTLAAPGRVQADCPEDCDGDGVEVGTDCDDSDPNRYPTNAEFCDEADHDEDCDPETFGHQDRDGDRFDDAACCNFEADGDYHCGDDCDDTENGVHPIASEVCNGFDDDCNGLSDEGLLTTFYGDGDGDGFGEGADVDLCPGNYSGLAGNDADCDDAVAAIIPGAQVCTGATTVAICMGDGAFVSGGTCGASEVCAPQPNGTGVCVEEGPGQPSRR